MSDPSITRPPSNFVEQNVRLTCIAKTWMQKGKAVSLTQLPPRFLSPPSVPDGRAGGGGSAALRISLGWKLQPEQCSINKPVLFVTFKQSGYVSGLRKKLRHGASVLLSPPPPSSFCHATSSPHLLVTPFFKHVQHLHFHREGLADGTRLLLAFMAA